MQTHEATVARLSALSDPVPLSINRSSIDALAGGALKPPLVSFVLINWNYGHYLGHTLDSIRAQDYPHFECLVIDNGSTDDSRAVIERHTRGDSRFTVEYFSENLGQLGAALWALDRIRGGFVTFVDADDVLFPSFASTHLQVHLALPRSVAMTSSNLVEIGPDGNIATSGYLAVSPSLKEKHTSKGLREQSTVVRFSTVSDDAYARLDQHTVSLPNWLGGWIWAPGTSNMFRRSILGMAAIGGETKKFMRSADGHFNPLCHVLGGTALIDIPLCAYRQHDKNFFSTRESVPGLRQGTKAYAAKSKIDTRETLEVLLDRVEFFDWILGDRYWSAIDQIPRVAKKELRAYYDHPASEKIFTRHIGKMRAVFGDERLINKIRARFPVATARRIFKNGLADGWSFSFRWKFYQQELKRFVTRKKRRRR